LTRFGLSMMVCAGPLVVLACGQDDAKDNASKQLSPEQKGYSIPHEGGEPDAKLGPVFESEDLTINRYDALPNGTAQVVVYYDGDRTAFPALQIGFVHPETKKSGWYVFERLQRSSNFAPGKISTFELKMRGYDLNGKFKVKGVKPDGEVDGLAFGVLWKDSSGRCHLLKSRSSSEQAGAKFIGMWPCWMSLTHFRKQVSQLGSSFAIQQAQTIVMGCEMVDNGTHSIEIIKPVAKRIEKP
jgi:hypothetical protein